MHRVFTIRDLLIKRPGAAGIVVLLLMVCIAGAAEQESQPAKIAPALEEPEYVVEKPGTITFKHGIVIVGKVEKPQVLIFLPKEKSYHREITFTRSFSEELAQPLPFDPVID